MATLAHHLPNAPKPDGFTFDRKTACMHLFRIRVRWDFGWSSSQSPNIRKFLNITWSVASAFSTLYIDLELLSERVSTHPSSNLRNKRGFS